MTCFPRGALAFFRALKIECFASAKLSIERILLTTKPSSSKAFIHTKTSHRTYSFHHAAFFSPRRILLTTPHSSHHAVFFPPRRVLPTPPHSSHHDVFFPPRRILSTPTYSSHHAAFLPRTPPTMSNPPNLAHFPREASPFFAPLKIAGFAPAKLTTNTSQHFAPASPFRALKIRSFASAKPSNRTTLPTQIFPSKPPQLRLLPMWSLAFSRP